MSQEYLFGFYRTRKKKYEIETKSWRNFGCKNIFWFVQVEKIWERINLREMENRQQKEYATHSCKIMQMNFWIFFVWKTDWCMDFQFFRKNFYWFFCFGFSADENPLSMQCLKFLLLMLLWWYSNIDKESFFFFGGKWFPYRLTKLDCAIEQQ